MVALAGLAIVSAPVLFNLERVAVLAPSRVVKLQTYGCVGDLVLVRLPDGLGRYEVLRLYKIGATIILPADILGNGSVCRQQLNELYRAE